jgi:signal transduction histidine kinase
VPDDIPPPEPSPGALTAPAQVPVAWWERFVLWDIYVALVAIGTGSLVAASDSHTWAVRAGAVALIVGLVGWYLAWGRPLMRKGVENWRGYVYVAGAAALFVPAVALVNGTSFVLWMLCPHAYMVLPVARATAAVVGYNAAYLAVVLVREGEPGFLLEGPLQAAAIAITGSVVFGTWATHVSRQNDERALLIQELERTRADVVRLSREAGAVAERQRLAGDIHDTIAQGLSSIIMLMQVAQAELDTPGRARQQLALALATARENLGEARALVGALTPAALDGSSLDRALSRLVDRFRAETGVEACFVSEGDTGARSMAADVVLLRGAQEALANVRKHAAARRVTVLLRQRDDLTTLQVDDDGSGFEAGLGTGAGGYGLAAMAGRVEQVSGTLTVESAPGRGTTVRIQVPTS